MRRARPLRRDCRGSITAETAVVFPVLVLMLCFALWGVLAAATSLRCGDAARIAARALARGESESAARRVALANAPANAEIRYVRERGMVHVTVTTDVRPFGSGMRLLPALTVHGSAAAEHEGVS